MAELTTPVRGVLPVTDTPLSGVGQVGYGITVGSTGASEDWLVQGGTQGGVWTLTTPANTWARRSDIDTSSEYDNMPYVQVREGDDNVAGSVWYYSGIVSPTIGTSPLPWTMRTRGRPTLAGTGLADNLPYVELPQYSGVAGTYDVGSLAVTFTDRGVVSSIATLVGQETHIDGFIPSWVSGGSPVFSAGEAWVPGLSSVLEIPNDQTGPVNTLPIADLMYFYLQPTTTSPNIRGIGTAPQAAYLGTARNMTGDTNTRYICALRTNAAGTAFYNFRALAYSDKRLLITYLEDTTASPFRVVNGGSATANQTVNLGPSGLKLVPAGCRMVWARVTVNATSGTWIDNSEMSTSPASSTGEHQVATTERGQHVWISLDANQSFRWANTVAGGSTNIDIKKYIDLR